MVIHRYYHHQYHGLMSTYKTENSRHYDVWWQTESVTSNRKAHCHCWCVSLLNWRVGP